MIEVLRAQCAYLAIAGTALFALCLGLIALRAYPESGAPGAARKSDAPLGPAVWWLVAAVVIGAALRLYHLDAKGLSHPEGYVPNLALAPGISEPPVRHDLFETAKWHFNYEIHPFGWYLAMWAWTKVVGANLFTIRLPQALIGVASIPLIYRVGTVTYGRRAGVIAACLLAIHGFHVFWSQGARMYAAGGFFGLLATWLLVEQYRRERPSRWVELGYVAAIVACALTVEYAWILLAMHLIWIALNQRSRQGIPRPAYFATLAFIVAAPMLSHALIGEKETAASGESLQFVARFFSFGLLFQHGAYDSDVYAVPMLWQIPMFLAGLALAGIGAFRGKAEPASDGTAKAPSFWFLVIGAVGASLVMLAFAGIAHWRNTRLMAASVIPFLALAFPVVIAFLVPWLTSRVLVLGRMLDALRPLTTLPAVLAILPVAIVAVFSAVVVPVTAERAFLIFVPYLLILTAAGVSILFDIKALRIPLAAALAVLFASSVVYLYGTPISPRDYQGIAAQINARQKPGDMIFLRPKSWIDTPVTYYLDHRKLVATDYAGAVARNPQGRVWVVLWAQPQPYPEMRPALAGYTQVGTLHAEQASALLFAPRPPAVSAH